MSPRGNDLVRRYLWMAALTASRFNPACRALYARVRAKHPDHPAIAIGHVMRKLLHLAFAVWKSGRPFNPKHYPWEPTEASDSGVSTEPAAGLRKGQPPIRSEVAATGTATGDDPHPDVEAPVGNTPAGVWLDFASLKSQLPMARVLDHLGLTPRLKGTGPQRRCTCPIHRGDGRGRTFSVNLEANVYQCFAAECASQGDVIDLWASVNRMSLRDAALDLVRIFGLEPSPVARTPGTEKRNG